MSSTEAVVTICDWCLQEALVQTIDEELWRFWKIISTEDPNMTSHRNICDKCKSRYDGFSIYIERCKINAFKIDKLLSTREVKVEPSIEIKYPTLIKTEVSNEVDSHSFGPALQSGIFIEGQMLVGFSNFPTNDSGIDELLPAGNVKKEPLIDIEDDLINNEEDIWKEEAFDPDHPTASGGKEKGRLMLRIVSERRVLPGSIVHQKKVNNNFLCTYCGKTFTYSCELKIHLHTHTGEKPFKCSYCNKSFAQSGSLNVHLRIHTGEKPFKCSYCNKSFTTMGNLNVHLRIHTGENPFKCLHCSKSFTTLSCLNIHLRIHTGEKPFKCSHCNKSFTQMYSLKIHLRTHTGEKRFKCSHCSKSFTRSGELNVHLRTHTGEKPFKCSHCNKSYTQLSSLNDHLRSHTGEKPFKCLHCTKSFTRLRHLNDHLRTHKGDKPFKCSHCGKSWAKSSILKRHLRIHENDK